MVCRIHSSPNFGAGRHDDVSSIPMNRTTSRKRASRAELGVTAIGLIAVGRVVIGVIASLAPPAWLEWVFGASARGSGPRALARMAGVRDVALGAATLAAALDRPPRAARLASLGVLCDAADATISVITPGLPKRARALNVTAGTLAAVAGLIAAWQSGAPFERSWRGSTPSD
jgi:hypothetical protein